MGLVGPEDAVSVLAPLAFSHHLTRVPVPEEVGVGWGLERFTLAHWSWQPLGVVQGELLPFLS